MSTQRSDDHPPRLLLRMSTPPPKRRKRESSKDSREQWTSSERESVPDSKRPRLYSANWRSGQEQLIRKRGRPWTRTSQKLNPSLLSRMRVRRSPERVPRLLERLSSPEVDLRGSETKSKNSWTRSQEERPTKMMMNQESSNDELGRRICRGSTTRSTQPEGAAASRPAELSSSSVKIYPESELSCASPTTSLKESHLLNGTAYSEENQSILTKFSQPCTLSTLMRRERAAWEQLRSFLPSQSRSDMSELEPNGLPPSEECPRQSFSSSPIEETNCSSTLSMSRDSSPRNIQVPIQKSYSMTSLSEIRSEEGRTFCSPISIASTASVKRSSMQMGSSTKVTEKGRPRVGKDPVKEKDQRRMSVGVSTGRQDVASQKTSATISTSVKGVEREDTVNSPVPQRRIKEMTYGMRPKYLCYNLWDPESNFSSNTADWTLTAEPLEGPPQSELDNEVVKKTICENPHMREPSPFQSVTPIRVDIFESYFTTHPNRKFVDSVCKGLREGFWPWARTPCEGYPLTNDESNPPPLDERKANFLRSQCDFEISKGRYSAPFKHGLLPGMYCMPIYAVPKPHSSDLRLVNDQSYGKHSLNSMIEHNKVTGFPLDNLVNFGEMLMDLERKEPGEQKVAWKSDIAEAYWILPMHPHWQVKQVTRIDDEYHIDRCNVFGGCGSGGLFISVNSLVAWIAK
jgi:hypothetical protein